MKHWTPLLALAVAVLVVASGCGGSTSLRKVKWVDVTLPASICGGQGTIQLHNGEALIHSTRWAEWPLIEVTDDWSKNGVVFGKLGGTDAAAVPVNCNNGGGTADGVLLYAQAIFSASGRPKLVGVITPRVHPANQPASIVGATFRGNDVIASEAFYGSADGTCCPSGRATTVWHYQSGKFKVASSVVTKKPFH